VRVCVEEHDADRHLQLGSEHTELSQACKVSVCDAWHHRNALQQEQQI
jgi:hypothetical protein